MYIFILCTYSSYVRIHLVYIHIYLMYILLCKCNNPTAVFRNFSGGGQVKVLRRGILIGCECAPPPQVPPSCYQMQCVQLSPLIAPEAPMLPSKQRLENTSLHSQWKPWLGGHYPTRPLHSCMRTGKADTFKQRQVSSQNLNYWQTEQHR